MPKYIMRVVFVSDKLIKTVHIPDLRKRFNDMCEKLGEEISEFRGAVFKENDELYLAWENLNPVYLKGYMIFSLVRPTVATAKMGFGKVLKRVFLSNNAFFSQFKPDWNSFFEVGADEVLGFAMPCEVDPRLN